MNYKKIGLTLVLLLSSVGSILPVGHIAGLRKFNRVLKAAKSVTPGLQNTYNAYVDAIGRSRLTDAQQAEKIEKRENQIRDKFGEEGLEKVLAAAPIMRPISRPTPRPRRRVREEEEEVPSPPPLFSPVVEPGIDWGPEGEPEWAKKKAYTKDEANEAASVGGSLYAVADALLDKADWTLNDEEIGAILIQKLNLAKDSVGALEKQKFVDLIEDLQERI